MPEQIKLEIEQGLLEANQMLTTDLLGEEEELYIFYVKVFNS